VKLKRRLAEWLLSDVKQSGAVRVARDTEAGRPRFFDWDTDAAVKEGYKANIYVYACVRRLVQSADSVTWIARRRTSSGLVTLDSGPAVDFLSRPNPTMSFKQLVGNMTAFLNLAGNDYWYFVQAGQRVEVWPLRPDRVRVIPGKDEPVEGYEYKIGTHKRIFDPETIVHHRFFDPGEDFYGLPPLRAAGRTVDISNEATDFQKASLQSRFIPDGALVYKHNLDDDQYAEVRSNLKAKKPREILILEGDFDWKQFSLSAQEMDFIDSQKMTREDICNAFGVPGVIVGIMDRAIFNNFSEASRALWKHTVIPYLQDVRDTFNMQIAPRFGDDVVFDFDVSEVDAIQEARLERVEQARNLWTMGMPLNQAIDELGLGFDPVPGGDTGYIGATVLPSGQLDASNARAIEPPAQTGLKAINLNSESQKAHYWKAFDRQRIGWSGQVRSVVEERFRGEREAVMRAFDAGQRDLDTVIDAQSSAWNSAMTASWTAVVEFFGEQTLAQLVEGRSSGRHGAKQEEFDPAVDATRAFIARVVASRVTGILDTTKRRLREQIRAGIENSETIPKISQRLRETYRDFTTRRATAIARSEVISASNAGSREAAKQSGVVKLKEWISSRDERVRVTHQPGVGVDGEQRSLDERYTNGLMFPGDPDGPLDETIQCRCVESYRTREGGS